MPLVKFGTDGIRGRVGKVLTPSLALDLGYWFGKLLPNKGPVLIGQDSRISGNMLVSALTAGLTAAGREVWILGICPTPAISILTKKIEGSGGLMVSASHNPPEDNGIKLFDSNGSKINNKLKSILEKKLTNESLDKDVSSAYSNYGNYIQKNDLLDIYKLELKQSVNSKRLDGIKIALDLCWGSASVFAEEVFQDLGANITVINDRPQGEKINVNCGSTNLDQLKQAVFESNSEMGFAFDGDADRMMAIDKDGNIIDGDHVLYLWGTTLKNQNSLPDNRLIGTIMSNLGFEKAWKQQGGLFDRTPVGDQYILDAMLNTGAALGGEQSGHILSSAHGYNGDGVLTALQLATICNQRQQTLAEWYAESFEAFPMNLINVPLSNGIIADNWQDCSELNKAVLAAEEDMGKDGRVLLRKSGTEPLLRVMVEGIDRKAVDKWSSHLAKVVDQNLN